jgi:hypothetical protein
MWDDVTTKSTDDFHTYRGRGAAVDEPARYFGSLGADHGEVLDVDDCPCAACALFDLWDARRRFLLMVRRDRDGQCVELIHVRGTSFTGTRSR